MKNILCFGDSNTWGFMPHKDKPPIKADNRFPRDVRWPGKLEKMLGEDWHIIEEGLNGRTAMFDCPMEDHRNGLKAIDFCLLSAMPVDLVILMLGTNDVKLLFDKPAYVIAQGIHRLIGRIRHGDYGYGPGGKTPEILVVTPARVTKAVLTGWLKNEFDAESVVRSAQLSEYYRQVTDTDGVHFLDAGSVISADSADGIHMNAESHARLAEMICEEVKRIFG